MKIHRPLAWIVVSLVSVLFGVTSTLAEGVSGIVKSVDVKAQKIVVTPTGQEKTVAITLTDKTNIKTESGEAIALKELKAGDGVGVAHKEGKAQVIQVAVKPAELVGHVKSVGSDFKSFVVTTIGDSVDSTVAVNAETSIITINGRKLVLKELKKGDGVGIAHTNSLACKIVVNVKAIQ